MQAGTSRSTGALRPSSAPRDVHVRDAVETQLDEVGRRAIAGGASSAIERPVTVSTTSEAAIELPRKTQKKPLQRSAEEAILSLGGGELAHEAPFSRCGRPAPIRPRGRRKVRYRVKARMSLREEPNRPSAKGSNALRHRACYNHCLKDRVFLMRPLILGLASRRAYARLASWLAGRKASQFFPVSDLKPGMVGVGRTVFNGDAHRGVPRDDHRRPAQCHRTSPRPDPRSARGRTACDDRRHPGHERQPGVHRWPARGAVSYSLGSFPQEPLAGITPIAEMTDAVELVRAARHRSRARDRVAGARH